MAVSLGEADFNFRLRVPEYNPSTGMDAAPLTKDHIFDFVAKYAAGVGSSKVGAVHSKRYTISGATTIDLSGSLTSLVDSTVTVSFPILMGIFVKNLSTTSGQKVLMGAGSNPLLNWIGAAGDLVKIGPSGFIALWDPIDGYAVTAGTGDALNFDTAAGTPEIGVLLLGRAS